MSLRAASRDVESYIEMGLETLSFGLPVEQIGQTCDDLCQNYRTLACCSLLLAADTDGFLHALHRSGHVRLFFLSECARRPGYRDPYSAFGNSAGFFDAFAARDFELAGRIAALSPNSWLKDYEYADDFHFAFFCHLASRNETSVEPEMQQVLASLREICGAESARAELCAALLARDQTRFDTAFDKLLDERKLELDEERPQFFPDDRIVFRTKSRVYVEGIAVLNLAERLGLVTAPEYRYCPVTARLPRTTPFPEDAVLSRPL